ncbi:DUF4058 family protein [Oscillatoria sp. FACHB-1406]|nr:DUF4058 family protein [Oscillatoria sp. FACHB-1406]
MHNRLIVNLADTLGPQLRPKYRVAVEKRTYLDRVESVFVGLPDVTISTPIPKIETPSEPLGVLATAPAIAVRTPMSEEVREYFLEIREIATETVIAAIEILSPKNKRSGVGRESYLRKRWEVLGSLTHFIEIDLLREGKPMELVEERPTGDYNILVSRSNRRPWAELYVFGVRSRIPAFALPLCAGDEEPLVDLQAVLSEVYQRAGFDLAIDYAAEANPLLPKEDRIWADEILRQQGRR